MSGMRKRLRILVVVALGASVAYLAVAWFCGIGPFASNIVRDGNLEAAARHK
jgi:hypothetical protein